MPAMLVSFQPNPLFNAPNFMPGDIKEAQITITNTGEAGEEAYIEAVNVSNPDDLAGQMNLDIDWGGDLIYSGNFGDFLNAGPVPLSGIGAGGAETYDLKINFIEGSGNDYQGKSLGFDICVGLKGGNQRCTGDPAISEEGDTSGGGGGGGSGGSHLMIWREQTAEISSSGAPASGWAVITWETSKPATSQVIYGPSSASYALNMSDEPKFGYPLISDEDLAKKINHSVTLTGLDPGETYVYRVVSRASPASVSYEHQFVVPDSNIPGNVSGVKTAGSNTFEAEETQDGEAVLLDNEIGEEETAAEPESNLANMAAAFLSGIGDAPFFWWVLIIIAIIILGLLLRRRSGNRSSPKV